jgi:CheY-like chemotaxis protein
MRILLIDDDHDDQLLFRDAICDITSEIVFETADNGIEGLKCLTRFDQLPDILFLDINMPLMDGRETLQSIRADHGLDNIVIIICSTSNSETDLEWAAQSNAQYMVKPNDFPSLIRLLSPILKQTPAMA